MRHVTNLPILSDIPYVGRFAPSPTGPLHFGSLVAAVASWVDARAVGGRWLLRIEDVDAPRVVPGAAEGILNDLARFGLLWDGVPVWQHARTRRYAEVLARLKAEGAVYGCACTRKEMADSQLAPDGARRYPGTCRDGLPPGRAPRAWRLRTQAGGVEFEDAVQGVIREDVGNAVGDFILLRADGLFAYQLAVVVDDADAGVTEVVRGADLLDSTCRQIYLQQVLGYAVPGYLHVPVATNRAGEKLSKQTLARAVSAWPEAVGLRLALEFLGQCPPAALDPSPQAILSWAVAHWRRTAIPQARAIVAPPQMLGDGVGN